jgi:hypothetical protein
MLACHAGGPGSIPGRCIFCIIFERKNFIFPHKLTFTRSAETRRSKTRTETRYSLIEFHGRQTDEERMWAVDLAFHSYAIRMRYQTQSYSITDEWGESFKCGCTCPAVRAFSSSPRSPRNVPTQTGGHLAVGAVRVVHSATFHSGNKSKKFKLWSFA